MDINSKVKLCSNNVDGKPMLDLILADFVITNLDMLVFDVLVPNFAWNLDSRIDERFPELVCLVEGIVVSSPLQDQIFWMPSTFRRVTSKDLYLHLLDPVSEASWDRFIWLGFCY